MADRRAVRILEYNAFTDLPFAGNPAGVVLDASELSPRDMQLVARQMNLAETAFLMSPSTGEADIRLRWFTPTREVTLCGHATIAAFTAAAEHGLIEAGETDERELRVETLSGILRIRVGRRHGRVTVAMQLPVPELAPLELERSTFAALWGVAADDLEGEWLLHRALDYWFLPVRDLATLRALILNPDKVAAFDPAAAFAFYTRETVEAESDWHLRFFAPFHGVPEDIVTGSAQGPMGVVHLRDERVETAAGWNELRGEQGDHLDRPGRVIVRVHCDEGTITDLEIAGSAVPMLEGEMRT